MPVLSRRSKSTIEPAAEAPAGFVPLPPPVRGAIIDTIGAELHRFGEPDRDAAMRFRANGRQALVDQDHPVDVERTLVVTVPAYHKIRAAQPGAPWSYADAVPAETIAELDGWLVHPDGRCWRPGLPVPPGQTPFEEWVPLSGRVRTLIARAHGEVALVTNGRCVMLYDPRSGQRRGTTLDPSLAEMKGLYVRLWSHVHPDDLELGAVRVDPRTGQVSDVPVREVA